MVFNKYISENKPSTKALLALILGAAVIGFAPILVRLSHVDPTATAFWRVILAMPFFLIWAARQGGPSDAPKLQKWSDYKGLFLGGVLFALDLAFWHCFYPLVF